MRFIISILILVFSSFLIAQENDYPFPPLSAKGKVMQQVGFTTIEVEYERPSVRNRKIFGELVPWSKLWRAGAGSCTTLKFDTPVRVGGQTLTAGKYSMLAIPNPDSWVVIFNRDTTLYGTGFYNADLDVARFVVPVNKAGRHFETFTISIDVVPNDAKVYISWEDTEVSFDIETFSDQRVDDFIKTDLMDGKVSDPDFYTGAASYYYFQNKNLLEALDLAQKGIDAGGNEGWARNERIAIFEKLHMYQDALDEIDLQLKHIKKDDYEKEEYRERSLRQEKMKAKSIMEKMSKEK